MLLQSQGADPRPQPDALANLGNAPTAPNLLCDAPAGAGFMSVTGLSSFAYPQTNNV